MPDTRSGEQVHSGFGRLIVFAVAIVLAGVMVWALYDGSDRSAAGSGESASVAPSPAVVIVSVVPVASGVPAGVPDAVTT
jgi:hypothetical protein